MGGGAGARALLRQFVRAGRGFGDYNLRECGPPPPPPPPARHFPSARCLRDLRSACRCPALRPYRAEEGGRGNLGGAGGGCMPA